MPGLGWIVKQKTPFAKT